ncbi:alanine racemase [Sciscionella sediminilitoris]|uniref:alanine racemase n=1 Tax=Sciscionella sediminilitoris TaxID=1445613 RepID=UPI0004DFA5F1|nr:alanine racemase [Sciscionella sp. SE31]
MFLNRLLEKNPRLPSAAIEAHQRGELPANTYVLDTDMIARNAAVLAEAARGNGLHTYLMAKQYGRNPDASEAAIAAGLGPVVSVDPVCTYAAHRHDVPVGHVGHLVQPHRGSEGFLLDAHPEVVTVFSVPTAERIGAAARDRGIEQAVLLRVQAPGDRFYFGHGGGFALADIEREAKAVQAIEGIRVAGVTSFPCLLADAEARRIVTTPNAGTVAEAADRLRTAGFPIEQVNMPGTTSARTLPELAAAGATHVEPGNAVLGTTPLHLFEDSAPELPAIVLLSEVSHVDGEDAYVFGAGYYIDKVLGEFQLTAVAGRDESALDTVLNVDTADDGAIHYYNVLCGARKAGIREGDSVVFCFRPQSFVTRGRTLAMTGLRAGAPVLRPRYDQEANLVAEPV